MTEEGSTTCRWCGKPVARCPVGNCGFGWVHTVVSSKQENDHYCYPTRRIPGERARAFAMPEEGAA